MTKGKNKKKDDNPKFFQDKKNDNLLLATSSNKVIAIQLPGLTVTTQIPVQSGI